MQCFKRVTKFVTSDGVEHDSIQDATTHVENKIENALDQIVLSVSSNSSVGIRRQDQIALVKKLYEQRETIRKLLNMEHHFLEEED
jgi:galactitol-specific phosphotransferase system IIB component